jgi:hypothetical protein
MAFVMLTMERFFSKNEGSRRDCHVFVTNEIEGSPHRMVGHAERKEARPKETLSSVIEQVRGTE